MWRLRPARVSCYACDDDVHREIAGQFEPVVAPDEAPSVSFHAALKLNAAAIADAQARVRTHVLRTFFRRGLIDNDDTTELRVWASEVFGHNSRLTLGAARRYFLCMR